MLLAAPDPPAQLVKLGEAEAIGMLDDHQSGIGDVDADLDHRGRDQHGDAPGGEGGHHRVLLRPLHAAVDDADLVAEAELEQARPLLGGGEVGDFAFLTSGQTQ